MSMTLIQKRTVDNTTTATVVFSVIPQTYTDLVLFASARTPRPATNDAFTINVNSGVTVVAKRTYANIGAGLVVDTNSGLLINGNSSTSGVFSNVEIYIGDYAGGDHKPFIFNGVVENNAQQAFPFWGGGSFSTLSPITSITLDAETDPYFTIGSTFALYGITAGSDGVTSVTGV